MNEIDKLTQIMYEISMSIGDELDMDKMLRKVALTMLKKLNGIAFVVFQKDENSTGYAPVYITPKIFSESESFSYLEGILQEGFNQDKPLELKEKLPHHISRNDDTVFHLMELPDYGLLAFFRGKGFLSDPFVASLTTLNKKLAVACKACVFHGQLEQLVERRTFELLETNSRLTLEVKERKLIESQLIESKQKLLLAKEHAEAANKAKSQFLSRMSHELRTPLNAILGFSQLLEIYFSNDVPEKMRVAGQEIASAGKHLLELVDDVLDIVKIEQDKNFEIPLENVTLASVIDESLALVRGLANEHNIQIHCKPVTSYAISNGFRLKQVLVNLLTNAIKYNKENGQVFLSTVETAKGEVEILVEDTGIGIQPEEQEKIFDPFTRLTYATQQGLAGTGIGLTLTKFLVEKMNGSIGLESNEHGTKFWLRFPVGKPADEVKKSLGALMPIPKHVKRVLNIEDNHASQNLMSMLFASYPDIDLTVVDTAEEGIELARTIQPDLIFLDINLPGMSGIEAVQIIKSSPELENTYVVALSADAMPDQIELATGAGFDQYMTKPIDIKEIAAVLSKL